MKWGTGDGIFFLATINLRNSSKEEARLRQGLDDYARAGAICKQNDLVASCCQSFPSEVGKIDIYFNAVHFITVFF